MKITLYLVVCICPTGLLFVSAIVLFGPFSEQNENNPVGQARDMMIGLLFV
jgi:hypothetical protein